MTDGSSYLLFQLQVRQLLYLLAAACQNKDAQGTLEQGCCCLSRTRTDAEQERPARSQTLKVQDI